MKPFSEKYRVGYRILCWILALHLINYSVDPRDPYPEDVPEDLSINDIESILEFVVEVAFGWEDAFAEFDEHDNEDNDTVDLSKFFCSNKFTTLTHSNLILRSNRNLLNNFMLLPKPAKGIISPPPEA